MTKNWLKNEIKILFNNFYVWKNSIYLWLKNKIKLKYQLAEKIVDIYINNLKRNIRSEVNLGDTKENILNFLSNVESIWIKIDYLEKKFLIISIQTILNGQINLKYDMRK